MVDILLLILDAIIFGPINKLRENNKYAYYFLVVIILAFLVKGILVFIEFFST